MKNANRRFIGDALAEPAVLLVSISTKKGRR